MPVPVSPVIPPSDTFAQIFILFLEPWGMYLMGFFVFGLAFMVGRSISFSLLIAFPLFVLLGAWFSNPVFIGLSLVILVLGLVLRQMGV